MHPWAGRRLLVACLLVAVLAGVAALLPLREAVEVLLAWIGGLGGWGPLVFLGVYALVVVLLLPTWGFSMGGGALFGTALGLPIVFGGAFVGSTAAFFLGRTLLRDRVARWVEAHPHLGAVDAEIGRRGWLVALLLRLSPLVPYNLLNYALGATRLSLRGYLASLFGMLPVLALYVTLGSTLGAAVRATDRARSPLEWTLLGLGLGATLLVTVWLGRVAGRRLPDDERGAGATLENPRGPDGPTARPGPGR